MRAIKTSAVSVTGQWGMVTEKWNVPLILLWMKFDTIVGSVWQRSSNYDTSNSDVDSENFTSNPSSKAYEILMPVNCAKWRGFGIQSHIRAEHCFDFTSAKVYFQIFFLSRRPHHFLFLLLFELVIPPATCTLEPGKHFVFIARFRWIGLICKELLPWKITGILGMKINTNKMSLLCVFKRKLI